MQFTIVAILAAASAVMALPQAGGLGGDSKIHADDNISGAGNGMTCGVGTKQSCCDTSAGDGLGNNILGGSCLVPNLISISSVCSGTNTYCCPVNQSGDLDIAATCIPISA